MRPLAAKSEEGRAQVGPRPGMKPDGYSSREPGVSPDKRGGVDHVRTLYGEGTARDLLRAV
jgi:hypothetical protein